MWFFPLKIKGFLKIVKLRQECLNMFFAWSFCKFLFSIPVMPDGADLSNALKTCYMQNMKSTQTFLFPKLLLFAISYIPLGAQSLGAIWQNHNPQSSHVCFFCVWSPFWGNKHKEFNWCRKSQKGTSLENVLKGPSDHRQPKFASLESV